MKRLQCINLERLTGFRLNIHELSTTVRGILCSVEGSNMKESRYGAEGLGVVITVYSLREHNKFR